MPGNKDEVAGLLVYLTMTIKYHSILVIIILLI